MWSRFPFLLPLSGIVAGILTGWIFNEFLSPGSFSYDSPWGGIAIAIAVALFVFISRKGNTPAGALRLNPYHSLWIGFLFFGIGLLAQWSSRPFILKDPMMAPGTAAIGRVEEAHSYSSGDLYVVKVSKLIDPSGKEIPVGNMRINLKTDGFIASPDEILHFPAKFSRISDHPCFRPSGFSRRLEREGRLYECRALAQEIKTFGVSPTIRGTALRMRDRIAEKIEKSSLDRATSAFIISILLGDRSLLSDETFQIFSDAGAAHILALSGMHVAVILTLLVPLLFPLRLLRRREPALWVGVILLWIYAFTTGLAPSTTRACVMATFIALASSIQRKNSSGNALLAAACIILIFKPSSLFDAGFQLSVVCVACILTFAGRLNPIGRHEHPRIYKIVSLILVSLAATAGTWVITSHYFGKIPMLFLPVNILIIPLLPFYMWSSIAYTALLCLGFDPEWMAIILDRTFHFFSDAASFLSGNGDSVINFRASWPTVVLWLGGIAVLGYSLHRDSGRHYATLGIALLSASIVCIPFFSSDIPDSIIFHASRTDFGVTLYDGDKPKVKILPRHLLARFRHAGSSFTIIDCDIRNAPETFFKEVPNPEKDYLIVGSGALTVPLNDFPFIGSYKKIILHPSVSRKMEKEFIQQSADLNLNNIHYLRLQGPLEEIL